MSKEFYHGWRDNEKALRDEESKQIKGIDKSAQSTVAREKKINQINAEYRRKRARCRQHVAHSYWLRLTDHLGKCKCALNERLNDPARFKRLDVHQVWNNLVEYKTAAGKNNSGPFIAGRLACANVPARREDRTQKLYEVYEVKMCYHSMLAVLGIPFGSAQAKLFVGVFFKEECCVCARQGRDTRGGRV